MNEKEKEKEKEKEYQLELKQTQDFVAWLKRGFRVSDPLIPIFQKMMKARLNLLDGKKMPVGNKLALYQNDPDEIFYTIAAATFLVPVDNGDVQRLVYSAIEMFTFKGFPADFDTRFKYVFGVDIANYRTANKGRIDSKLADLGYILYILFKLRVTNGPITFESDHL